MKRTLPCWRRGLLLASLSIGLPALVAQTAITVKNPTFADADTDGKPDAWKLYPDFDGISSVAGGGVRLNDQSASQGLGVVQWLPAVEGTQYRATVELQGTGGIFVYLIFTPRIPGKDAEVSQIKLLEKRQWANAKAEKTAITVEATAPAGSKHLRLWIYSPNAAVADVTVSSLKLESLGTVAVPPSATPAPAAATPAAPSAIIPAGPVPAGNLLQNPSFADADGDGAPDSWNPYPPGDGSTRVLATAPGGGLVFKDNDKDNGLGLEQWVPVQEGLRYAASANVSGNGGIGLTLIFSKEKPNRPGDLKSVQLTEKSNRASAGKITETVGIAPAGAKWLKVWLYSPKIGVADVIVHQLTLTASTPAAPAAGSTAAPVTTSAPALPSGLTASLDFETGDLSQAHQGHAEGANVTVVDASQGPVREGRFSVKTALSKAQIRAEVPGHRSNAYGIARYGWSMYMPKDFDAESQFSIITQWHSWGTGRESPKDGGPPTCITIDKGHIHLKLQHQGDDGWTTKSDYLKLGSIEDMRGRWTDWVMEVNWQGPGKGGWLKLYKNDKLVLDYKGTTWYDDKDKGPYFKFGIYKGKSRWKGEEANTILYFDSGRMALGENSTYKMVAPSAYAPKPVKE
ncbi:MAG: hypothetical protein K0R17_35 [Rariglobus sp.]|jgi:hypothetical protein|nr:hypothetical protein [Rariglobus sp.]